MKYCKTKINGKYLLQNSLKIKLKENALNFFNIFFTKNKILYLRNVFFFTIRAILVNFQFYISSNLKIKFR